MAELDLYDFTATAREELNRLDPEDTVVVHDSDYDGHGAGMAAQMALGSGPEYKSHGDHSTPPDTPPCDTVILLDIGYGPDKLQELRDRHNRVIVIDHHPTNARAFLESAGFSASDAEGSFVAHDGAVAWFYSKDHSAAILAWEFFHDRPAPKLLRHIEDYDLWKWEMEGTDAVTLALDQIGLSRETIVKHRHAEDLQETGEPMVAYRDSLTRRFADRADTREQELPGIGKTQYAVVNAPICRSKTGEKILSDPDIALAVLYRVAGAGDVHVSLRSDESVDASALATELGGGGHARSAGFPSTMDELVEVFG